MQASQQHGAGKCRAVATPVAHHASLSRCSEASCTAWPAARLGCSISSCGLPGGPPQCQR